MELDMYLEKVYSVNWLPNKYIDIKVISNNKPIPIQKDKVVSIVEGVGYWRKANAIHNWFVTNVQEGEDDCKEYVVSISKLQELLETCKEVYKAKDTDTAEEVADEKLPTTSGLFFGSTDYDEYYYQYIKDTIEILEGLNLYNEENMYIYYRYSSSW